MYCNRKMYDKLKGFVVLGPIFILLFIVVVAGCTAPASEAPTIEVGAPPSLQSESNERVLITLEESELEALHIETHLVESQTTVHYVDAQGEVHPSPEHFSVVSAPISGRVMSIAAHEGEFVRKGDVLLELESLEFADLFAEYFSARAQLSLATSERDRLRELISDKISSQRELDQKEAAYSQAHATLTGARARLQALGLSIAVIEGWMEKEPASQSRLPIRATVTGFIDRHKIDLGQSVEAYEEMLTLVDPGHVLVKGYIPPALSANIRPGDPVRITDRDQPGRERTARISTVNPALDAENRSAVVNILTETDVGWPRPGTSLSLQIEQTSTQPELVIPLSSIQYEDTRTAVFVKQNENTFEKRFIEVGRIDQDIVIVRTGLQEGEEVAISQVFNLKAMSRFEQFGEE